MKRIIAGLLFLATPVLFFTVPLQAEPAPYRAVYKLSLIHI